MRQTVCLGRLLIHTLQGCVLFVGGTLALSGCGDAFAELTVEDFLGPERGKTYIYQGEGLRVEVLGVERLSATSVRIRQTQTLRMVGGNDVSSTTSYDISAVRGELIQENGGNRQILLKEPIKADADPWNINFEMEGRSLLATCRIKSVTESVVITATLPTATVACASEAEGLPVFEGDHPEQRFVLTRNFAKTIGLVSEQFSLVIASDSVAVTSRDLEEIVDGS